MTVDRIYTVTDIHTDESVTGADWETVMTTVRTWFSGAPEKVRAQLDELSNDPDWPGDSGSLENMLGLMVDYRPAA